MPVSYTHLDVYKRQQIKDGTGKQALHPIEVLYEALKCMKEK